MVSLLKSRLLLIRCPRLSTCSPIVMSVLEQSVLELAKHNAAVPTDMGRPQWIYSGWVASKVNEFLEPPFGGSQMTPADWDNLQAQSDSYCQQVVDWLDEIVRLNNDVLQDDREDFKATQARVVRRYPNLWIIELRGNQHGYTTIRS